MTARPHSPAPWRAPRGSVGIFAANGDHVCTMEAPFGIPESFEADAAMIAAAPDMLAALRAVVAADDANMADAVDYRTGHGEFASLRRAAGLARAVIARAEGRT